MTSFIIQVLIIILVLNLLFVLFASWIDRFSNKGKEKFIEKAFNKFSAILSSNVATVMTQYKAGPWYLVVYTQDSPYPLWISNNNIRSIHPDTEHNKLIVKQFNGEDMVIEHVDRYELCSANEMYDHDM